VVPVRSGRPVEVAPAVDVPADALTDRAVAWLRSNDAEPFFLWVHYMDPHGPYQSQDGFQYVEKYRAETLWRKAVHSPGEVTPTERERLRATYAEEVTFTDREIGRLLEAFEAEFGSAPTMTVLTADHGDEFFEHGSYSHENKLYDELIHVPLVVRPPATSSMPRERVDGLVPLLDVGPTIVDVAGVDAAGMEGTSLVTAPASEGEDAEEYVVSEAKLEPNYVGSIRTERWKFIDHEGDIELYDLHDDPAESENVVKSVTDTAKTLAERLDAHRERTHGSHLEEEALATGELNNRLRRLGYLE